MHSIANRYIGYLLAGRSISGKTAKGLEQGPRLHAHERGYSFSQTEYAGLKINRFAQHTPGDFCKRSGQQIINFGCQLKR